MLNVGSYKNSKRNIEPELLQIVTENSFLNYFLTNYNNDLLYTSLNIIKPKKSAGSLATLNEFANDEYQNFIRLFLIKEESAFGTEGFPGH